MPLRLLQSAAWTLCARLLSALLSFGVFAQVAAALPASAAARVLFFSFVFGFVLASLRTFHLVSVGITGRETRSQRLRALRSPARRVGWLALGLVPLTMALLYAQGVAVVAAVAGALLTVACAHDLDLLRAVAGRTPVLPWLTAAGGALGAGWLLAMPSSELGCALALLAQWVPVAAYHALYMRRVLKGRRRTLPSSLQAANPGAAGLRQSTPRTAAALLISVFDGAVLGAPFLLALPLAAGSAVDLALGNRLFIASLALFSLLASWVLSGDLQRIAQGTARSMPLLFAALQSALGLVLGGVYAALYAAVAGQPPTLQAGLIFVSLLLAYVLHATALRFGLSERTGRARVAVYVLAGGACYALLWLQRGGPTLVPVVAVVALALALPAAWMLWPLRRSRRS